MPAKNSIKIYSPDGFYHIYNRGVEKRDIFLDEQDFKVFLSYLKTYLSKPQDFKVNLQGETLQVSPSKHLKNYCDEIKLLAFCLMPNHFHLFIQQHEEKSMNYFMRSLLTKYSMYFNKKYRRVGSLFQGVYKAVPVYTEEQFIYLTKYIHLNPIDLGINVYDYDYSSLNNYLYEKKIDWLDPFPVLSYFLKSNIKHSYKHFIEVDLDDEIIEKTKID